MANPEMKTLTLGGKTYEIVDEKARIQEVESKSTELKPGIYQIYGEVDSLEVNLVSVDDNLVHEYCFEFTPKEGFTGLTVTPSVRWANQVTFEVGKVYQVSILRNVGVIIGA